LSSGHATTLWARPYFYGENGLTPVIRNGYNTFTVKFEGGSAPMSLNMEVYTGVDTPDVHLNGVNGEASFTAYVQNVGVDGTAVLLPQTNFGAAGALPLTTTICELDQVNDIGQRSCSQSATVSVAKRLRPGEWALFKVVVAGQGQQVKL